MSLFQRRCDICFHSFFSPSWIHILIAIFNSSSIASFSNKFLAWLSYWRVKSYGSWNRWEGRGFASRNTLQRIISVVCHTGLLVLNQSSWIKVSLSRDIWAGFEGIVILGHAERVVGCSYCSSHQYWKVSSRAFPAKLMHECWVGSLNTSARASFV